MYISMRQWYLRSFAPVCAGNSLPLSWTSESPHVQRLRLETVCFSAIGALNIAEDDSREQTCEIQTVSYLVSPLRPEASGRPCPMLVEAIIHIRSEQFRKTITLPSFFSHEKGTSWQVPVKIHCSSEQGLRSERRLADQKLDT